MSDVALLAIDPGTTSSRVIGFSLRGEILALEQETFEQICPASGWVEPRPASPPDRQLQPTRSRELSGWHAALQRVRAS